MEIFPTIKQIKYEGPQSNNPLAFKFYDALMIITVSLEAKIPLPYHKHLWIIDFILFHNFIIPS